MAKITGKGAPTRKTVGAIGDIYIDTITKKQYKCDFAYRSNNDSEFDCQWSEVKGVAEEAKQEQKKEQQPETKPEQPDKKEEPKPESPQHTNYTAYGKKSH